MAPVVCQHIYISETSAAYRGAAIQKADAPKAAKEAYLEQLIVRRELAINFVRFNPNYDNFESGAPWAHKSLAEHAADPRKIYSRASTGRRADP